MSEEVTFERLSEADIEWAWTVYNKTTREHIERVVDWSEEKQRAERLAGLRGGAFEAILDQAGRRIGLVEATNDGDDITIRHLELLPDVQGRGIGTAVIRSIVTRATASGQAVTLRVLHVNPRARALYERLGFVTDEVRSASTQMRLEPAVS